MHVEEDVEIVGFFDPARAIVQTEEGRLFAAFDARHVINPFFAVVCDVAHEVIAELRGYEIVVIAPVRKSNVRVIKPKTPRLRTPSTLALRRGGQNSK